MAAVEVDSAPRAALMLLAIALPPTPPHGAAPSCLPIPPACDDHGPECRTPQPDGVRDQQADAPVNPADSAIGAPQAAGALYSRASEREAPGLPRVHKPANVKVIRALVVLGLVAVG